MPQYGIPRDAYAAALADELADAVSRNDKAQATTVQAEIDRHAAEPDDAPEPEPVAGGPAPLDAPVDESPVFTEALADESPEVVAAVAGE